MVIINSPDVKLARINPIKIAKALNIVAKDFIKSVSKNNQGGITVRCHTTAQAQILKTITQLDQWAVTTKYAKSETQSKGVVTGIPTDITDDEILSACKKQGVMDAKRLMRKRDGTQERSLSICITFNTPNLPAKLQLGYEYFNVKPFIPPVIRCYNCQRLGHVANNCRSSTRCVRCGGSHSFDQCQQKEKVKCCRCGENHSSAYGGCVTIRQERKIQSIKVSCNISYADAAKAIKTNITIGPNTPSEISPKVQTITNTGNKPQQRKTIIYDTDSPTTNPTKISKDATTQTDRVAETQTESPQQHMFSEQYLQELLTGTMQIWDTIQNKDERALAVTSLINHVLHSEETIRHKEKQEKHRTPSQSPVDTKRNASGRRSTQTKSKGSSSEKTKMDPPTTSNPSTTQTPKSKTNKLST